MRGGSLDMEVEEGSADVVEKEEIVVVADEDGAVKGIDLGDNVTANAREKKCLSYEEAAWSFWLPYWERSGDIDDENIVIAPKCIERAIRVDIVTATESRNIRDIWVLVFVSSFEKSANSENLSTLYKILFAACLQYKNIYWMLK